MLNLDRDILHALEERPVSIRPLSLYASEMLPMQKNLLEKSTAALDTSSPQMSCIATCSPVVKYNYNSNSNLLSLTSSKVRAPT